MSTLKVHVPGRWLAFGLTGMLAGTASAQVTIDEPAADVLTLKAKATFRGHGPSGKPVTITNGGAPQTTTVASNGLWNVANVPLKVGFNLVTIKVGNVTADRPVTRGEKIAARPAQKVRIVWENDTDDELKKIAAGTLDAGLSATDQDHFVNLVHGRVAQLVTADYIPAGDITLTNSTDANVHIISMRPADMNGLFGESPVDCGNLVAGQTSRVYVGTFRKLMVSDLPDWLPMIKSDPLDLRAEDVAQALGRTAAHEFGHSLGLVAENGDCGWMRGCDGNHTCKSFQDGVTGLNRFNFGQFVMDPGDLSTNHNRIGEATKTRSASRSPASFCEFDRSYLRIIEPLP